MHDDCNWAFVITQWTNLAMVGNYIIFEAFFEKKFVTRFNRM